MDLEPIDFDLFNRETYSFNKIKEFYPEAEVEDLKTRYKVNWRNWKELNLTAYNLLKTETDFPKPRIERWTNGWIIRSHFWAVYKTARRAQDATLIGVMLNQKNFRIHLEWQHFKCQTSTSTPEQYNQLLKLVPDWAQKVDISDYYIWLSKDEELGDYWKLSDYLTQKGVQSEFEKRMNQGETFEIGYIIPKQTIKNVENLIAKKVDELDLLYTRR